MQGPDASTKRITMTSEALFSGNGESDTFQPEKLCKYIFRRRERWKPRLIRSDLLAPVI